MNMADLYNKVRGLPLTPKCNDLHALLGAVKAKEYSCPNCGKEEEDYDEKYGYEVDGEQYPKYFNEGMHSTIDGDFWTWDEVHCCTVCKTKYWFKNGT